MLVTTHPSRISEIEKLASEYKFLTARIGTTGGSRLDISVYGDLLISASLADLHQPWSTALQAALHDEVTA
jgi:hypothetical protein